MFFPFSQQFFFSAWDLYLNKVDDCRYINCEICCFFHWYSRKYGHHYVILVVLAVIVDIWVIVLSRPPSLSLPSSSQLLRRVQAQLHV